MGDGNVGGSFTGFAASTVVETINPNASRPTRTYKIWYICYSMIFFRSPSSNPVVRQQQMESSVTFDPMIGAVSLLGTLVFALVGAVAWLYWQQTKLFSNMNSLVSAFSELVQQTQFQPVELETPPPPPPSRDDDRASVEEEDIEVEKTTTPDIVDGPPAPLDTDTLDSKTKKELQDILTKRGIPFGKGDSKTVLVSLLKATA